MSRRQAALRWKPKDDVAAPRKQDQVVENGHARNRNYGFAKSGKVSGTEFVPRRTAEANRPPLQQQHGVKPRSSLVFVPYLPQDEGVADASETQEITDHLNRELSSLLKLKADDFWQEVSSNTSLHSFLDSYLLFRRRWYDRISNAGVAAGDHELSRRVFMVFLRMATNEDPGTGGASSARIHAEILREKSIFTVAKLMDICAIYGHDNTELTRRLVSDVFNAQPALLKTVPEISSQISGTIDKVYERSLQTIERSNGKPTAKLKEELVEVVEFIYDTVMTLDTFIEIHPSAAWVIISGESNNLLSSITSVHDLFLPSLKKIVEERHCSTLQEPLVKFSWDLLFVCFFDDAKANTKVNSEQLLQVLINLSSGGQETSSSILYCLSNQFDLSGHLQNLLAKGSVDLDDHKYAHLLSLLPETQPIGAEGMKRPPSTGFQETEEALAIRQSQIAQIKDLFPDYGDGFVSACLEVYDNNPEVVIQHILEGTLHPELSSLDVTSTVKPAMNKPVQAAKDKGKGKAVEEPPPESRQMPQGRFVRRTELRDEDAKKLLNERDAGSSSQTARLAMQIMYDDEYDDSFDDLDTNVADSGLETDSLVNLVSRKKTADAFEEDRPSDGLLQAPKVGVNMKPGLGRGKKQQEIARFYVKDGKNYSYKVAGSVAVSSAEEAEALKQQEAELIHGLGRGGNVPINMNTNLKEEEDNEVDVDDEQEIVIQQQQHGYGRGRGIGTQNRRNYASKSHSKKDLSLRKHMAGLR